MIRFVNNTIVAYYIGMLVTSLVFNYLTHTELRQVRGDYERLLVWACDHGNGGAECGEE